MGPVETPRIGPGTPERIGRVNTLIARVLGAATGTGPPNLFTTLARHRRLYRPWLLFASRLMPGGRLPAVDGELIILRVAASCGCEYEWQHHQHLGASAGLSPEEIARVRSGPTASGWSSRQALLLTATDELLADRTISGPTWRQLESELTEEQLIELPMLVGHYVMLAGTLNALGVRPDAPPRPPRGAFERIVRAIANRAR